jgi:hypothetical protein
MPLFLLQSSWTKGKVDPAATSHGNGHGVSSMYCSRSRDQELHKRNNLPMVWPWSEVKPPPQTPPHQPRTADGNPTSPPPKGVLYHRPVAPLLSFAWRTGIAGEGN